MDSMDLSVELGREPTTFTPMKSLTDVRENGTNESSTTDITGAIVYKSPSPPGFDFRREDHRLQTLKDWPAAEYLDPEPVARNGFYYFGKGDILRCFFCGVEHGDWWTFGEQDDDEEIGGDWWIIGGKVGALKSEHARWSKDCPFILNKPVGNVPTSDIDDIYTLDNLDGEVRPQNTYYMSKEARLTSFLHWPIRMRQTPAKLAEAGFYYTGIGDHVICFFCGGGLKDWEDNDDPLAEHEHWFSRCPFIIAVRKQSKAITPPAVATTSHHETPAAEGVSKENEDETTTSEINESTEEINNALNKMETTQKPDVGKQFEVMCKICFGAEANMIFLPCGHVLACMKCGSKMATCPVCRHPLSSIMKIFYP